MLGSKPKGLPLSIHHIEFYVSNALQSSDWYCINFGFRRFAKKEDKLWSSIAIRSGKVVLIFTTCKGYNEEFGKHLSSHGDAIRDIAFLVDDVSATVEHIVEGGGFLLKPVEADADDGGFVKIAVVGSLECDILHSLLDPKAYKGFFLPKYEHYDHNSDLLKSLNEISLISVDHFVINYSMNFVNNAERYYERIFGLEKIWPLDESVYSTDHSAMKIILLTNESKTIQISLAEPVPKDPKARCQTQEFLDYNGGAGVQHVAFLVNDIIRTVEQMKQRGVRFISVSDEYYTDLKKRLSGSSIKFKEIFDKIKQLRILMDFDDKGYLLQIFTEPVQDRPTLFFEIIERNNFTGFGAGNVQALFDTVEKERKKRGTLIHD